MELIKSAAAGSDRSGDVVITLHPNPGAGISVSLQSSVQAIFGEAIEETVRQVLREMGVQDAQVDVADRGALDFAIRARTQCAVCRAAETGFDWEGERLP